MAQSSVKTNIIDFADENTKEKTKEELKEEVIVEFGEQLRRARESKGMTQQSLAEQLFVTRQAVSRWEHGDRYPDLLTTKKISTILDVSLDELLSEKEMKNVVERNPVFERPLINNLIIAFYAAIVVKNVPSLTIMVGGVLTGEIKLGSNIIEIIFGTIVILVFVYGFICAIREALSPKRVGFISVIFWVATIIIQAVSIYIEINYCHIRRIPPDAMNIIRLVILGIIPSCVGGVASYLFFIKQKAGKLLNILIIFSAACGIVNLCMEWFKTYGDVLSYDFISMFSVIDILLIYACTYLLIICQMHMVNRKRALAFLDK